MARQIQADKYLFSGKISTCGITNKHNARSATFVNRQNIQVRQTYQSENWTNFTSNAQRTEVLLHVECSF